MKDGKLFGHVQVWKIYHLNSFVRIIGYVGDVVQSLMKKLKELVQLQLDQELKLAPKLTPAHINSTKYQKMNVGMAAQVCRIIQLFTGL